MEAALALAPLWSQRRLFQWNGACLDPDTYDSLVAYESPWIDTLLAASCDPRPVHSFRDFQTALAELIDTDARTPNASVTFLADQATRSQFQILVEQFAVDGLTEALAFLAVLPRLPLRAQMAVQRILIDEFGCGNIEMAHTQLYVNLLRELGSPETLDHFLASALDPIFEFVNLFHWMTKRSAHVEHFLGALAWFEGVVPTLFAPYVSACQRLKIAAHHYYSEHVHIDVFHARSALLAIRETARSQPFDYARAWQGVRLAHATANQAFEAAIALARQDRSTA